MIKVSKEVKADLLLLGVTLVWGASFPAMSIALKDIPPFTFIALRYFVSTMILIALFFKKFNKINKNTIIGGGLVGAALLAGTVFQVLGLVYTTPSKSGFISGLSIVLVPVFVAVIYKKLPDFKTVIGIILAMIGLGVMSLSGNEGFNYGDFLTLFCAIGFGMQIILVDKYAKNVDPILITIIEFFVVTMISSIIAMKVEKFAFNSNISSISAVLFTAIFCTIGAYLTQNKVQRYTNPTHVAIIFLGEPVFSAIFSVAFLGDKLTGKALIGSILIFGGMFIINVDFKKIINSKKVKMIRNS